jgi:hypothetical protein
MISDADNEANRNELENQTYPRGTHSFGYAVPYICDSERKYVARCTTGSVSGDGWGLGDLRFALRKTEIELF